MRGKIKEGWSKKCNAGTGKISYHQPASKHALGLTIRVPPLVRRTSQTGQKGSLTHMVPQNI